MFTKQPVRVFVLFSFGKSVSVFFHSSGCHRHTLYDVSNSATCWSLPEPFNRTSSIGFVPVFISVARSPPSLCNSLLHKKLYARKTCSSTWWRWVWPHSAPRYSALQLQYKHFHNRCCYFDASLAAFFDSFLFYLRVFCDVCWAVTEHRQPSHSRSKEIFVLMYTFVYKLFV